MSRNISKRRNFNTLVIINKRRRRRKRKSSHSNRIKTTNRSKKSTIILKATFNLSHNKVKTMSTVTKTMLTTNNKTVKDK